MPICEADPWRVQYFVDANCPPDVNIPTEDGDAYLWYPRYKWIYNKLLIAESQGLPCAPHGIDPPAFPVFSKPIYNMRGMGPGSRIIRSLKEYKQAQRPGHMWMELLQGEHVSTDVAVVDGAARWSRHSRGMAIGDGMFDYWIVEAARRPSLETSIEQWIAANLPGYTGMINIETIGERIIETHLRFSDQWPDLYGAGWIDALVALYRDKVWSFDDSNRRDGYSVVLFGPHGIRYRHPPAELLAELRRTPLVTSIQITFHEDRPPSAHSMPPGGFRLAIVNGWTREVGEAVREKLALSFRSSQKILKRPRKSSGRAAAASGTAAAKG